MIPTKLLARDRRHLAEWLLLLATLLGLGVVIAYLRGGLLLFVMLSLVAVLALVSYQRRCRAADRLAHHHDVERRTAERALAASEARLSAIITSTPDSLLISDAAGIITLANQQVERLLGYSNAELFGQSIEVLVPDHLRAHHPALRAQFADSPEVRRMGNGRAIKARRKDGSEVEVEISLGRIETEQGLFFACTLRDISERILAESDLRIAATAFESLEGVMVTDANSVILKVNRSFTEITGYTAEEVIGKTPRLLKSGRHGADFYREMWETIKRTGAWRGEIWDRRKNGEVYPKWLTISAVTDEHNAVTHYIGAHLDITERKRAEDKINELAYFDQLTGLPNRTLLQDRLKQAMTASDRSACHGALLFIDLDNFKTLNDTLGHDVGDQLLKQVAQRLKLCVREGDTVARLGGDEFVVILENLSTSRREAAIGTETAAEKILAAFSQMYRFGQAAHYSTASIGSTLFKGSALSTDDLMKQADLTMYKAKEAGRNKHRFYDPVMGVAVKERVELERDLREALEAKRFVLHYQAQVVGNGRVTGAEVLVRWQHPQRGLVSPGEFIPLAEDTGLILPLGHWVLETACAQLARWATRAATAHLTLAVNVSAKQFRQAEFVNQVLAVLTKTGANPKRLKLELTESLLVHNVEDIVEKMFALKAKGVGFSLDDFGTGYSSLSYLKRLPLDQLKIDQSFVRDLLIDPNDMAIAKTIIALARSLELGVIAEGVETAEQRDFLASSGCHAYQGYLFSWPLPLEGFERYADILRAA